MITPVPLTIKIYDTNRSLRWQPEPDITAFELALCIPVLLGVADFWDIELKYDSLPQPAKRHFVEEPE